jgi:sugar phosphate permease
MDHPIYRKVAWRIIPLLFICYIAAYLDRVNVSFAKLKMQADVPGLSESAYGFGAGLFLFGYFCFEVPSNILLERVGARLWIAIGIIVSNAFRGNTTLTLLGLTLATIGILATFPLFWPMPTLSLAGTAAAAGIAWINSVANLAGFFAPSLVGWITELTKRSDYGLYMVAAVVFLGGILVISFVPSPSRSQIR